jgi:hypothetical protein
MRLVNARDEAGIALVVAMVLSLMFSAMAIGITTLSITETGITYHQEVGTQALYNADSGVEVAKQQMAEFSQTKMDSLLSVWPGNGAIISNPQGFFPVGGLSHSDQTLGFTVSTTFTFADSALATTSQTFNFDFATTAQGSSAVTGERNVISEGTLRLSASRGTFSDFLIFTDVHYTPQGYQIWFHTSGYFDGRVHSNGKMRFAYFPTFEDLVTQVPQVSTYYNYGRPRDLDADRNGDRDVPNFYGGFSRGEDEVPLPGNSYSQERAALGLSATDTTAIANSVIRSQLGLDPTDPSPPPEGIYIPNDSVSVTGGIYVVGDLDDMTPSIDADGFQNYTMTDENGVTKTIVLDKKNHKTKIYEAGDSTVYTGLPRGMIYSTGTISSLGGPSRVADNVPAAIEEATQVTIAAEGDINLERDLAYESYENENCVLGVYSAGGDVVITTSAPDDLIVDAFVMASGPQGAFRVDRYDRYSPRGAVHLRGGVVQRYYGAFGTFSGSSHSTGYGRDFRYDRRGISPPYYPLTNIFKIDSPIPHTKTWREA